MPKQAAGFSLVEFVVAMAIGTLVLLFTVGLTAQAVPVWQLNESTNDLAQTIRAARTRAVYDGADARVSFDTRTRRFTADGRAVPSRVRLQRNDRDELEKVAELASHVTFAMPPDYVPPRRSPTEPISLRPPGAPPGDYAAVFDSRGLLQSQTVPGEIYIGDTIRNKYRRIRVSAFGIVTVERWQDQRWLQ